MNKSQFRLIHQFEKECIRTGILAERERIVKLLDELQNRYAEDYWQIDRLIELIKGQTK